MFTQSKAFSSYSVNDIAKAKEFYTKTLGVEASTEMNGMVLSLHIAGGSKIMIYGKDNHQAASFTVLNFPVANIDKAVDELTKKGVKFEHYDMKDIKTDEKGIARSTDKNKGPNIAWFKDPAGNVLSVLEG